MYRLSLPVVALVPLLLLSASPAWPEGSAKKREAEGAAAKMVVEALRHELSGDNQARQTLLDSAIETAPTSDTARWLAGYVRIKRQWVAVDEVPAMMAKDKRLATYATRRSRSPDTVAGQVTLAKWCGKRGLDSQQRAHWARVVQLDPNNLEARRALGHRRIADTWVTPEEIAAALDQSQWVARSLKRWSPPLRKLCRGLERRGRRARVEATERLREIDAVDAIPALEVVLGMRSEETALLAVEILGNINSPEASTALARQAVVSPWGSVRDAAAVQLRDRKLHDYVPDLLASMSTKIKSRIELAEGPRGGLIYRHLFYREGRDRADLAALDTVLAPVGLPADAANPQAWRNTLEQGRQQLVRARGSALETEVQRQNEQIEQWNDRVCQVLASATGESIANSPESWWQWWNDYNELYVSGPKPVKTAYVRDRQKVEPVYERDPSYYNRRPAPTVPTKAPIKKPVSRQTLPKRLPPTLRQQASQGRYFDCLAAETLVWTVAGAVPIHQINIGDLVLSQDPDRGQLAFKPVLAKTTRPPGQPVAITLGKERLEASGGHPFWVSGSGWTKARDLKPGEQLHSVTGTVAVGATGEGEVQPTYNLIVADFHTFFVGHSRILSHDNSVRKPTAVLVPGLPLGQ
jgi:hypothetical protein